MVSVNNLICTRQRLILLIALSVSFASALLATDYHVGPGQTYTQIGQVPWYSLQPGDSVYIHYRSTPYREKFLISSRGTPTQWIRVLGVPGPNGELPIISGDNATTGSNMHYHWQDLGANGIQWDGIVQIAVHADSASDPNGSAPLPGYIEVANLQVQDGYKTYHFTGENGNQGTYEGFAACIYARSAQHIVVRNNILTNCGQGFYDWTSDGSYGNNAWWNGLSADITLSGNYFYNNGQTNSYTEHQTYTEANGVTIEYNRYGPQRSGALGSQLKDRSAGTVIRYNYIEQSPQGWDIDMVEPQEGWDTLGSLPSYKQAFVYGNIIVGKNVNDPDVVHWNEDHYEGNKGRATFAGAKLLFYDNTIVMTGSGRVSSLFNEEYGGFECPPGAVPGITDIRNNIFYGSGVTYQFGYCGKENFNFGANWVSPGWTTHGGTVTGTSSIISPPNNDPGFVSVANNDFHLVSGSSAAANGGALAPEVLSNTLGLNLSPTQQYVYHTQVTARPSNGGPGSALGALDASGGSSCSFTVSPLTWSAIASSSDSSASVDTGSGCSWTASSNASWLTVTSGTNGTGYGIVNYSIQSNSTTSPRTGTLSIAGQTLTVTQAGAAPTCSYAISPASASVTANGGVGSVGVTSGSGCAWTAVSNTSWIAVSSGASGSGNGSVGYSATANSATTSRTGSITIAGKTFSVTQAGAAHLLVCYFTSQRVGGSQWRSRQRRGDQREWMRLDGGQQYFLDRSLLGSQRVR